MSEVPPYIGKLIWQSESVGTGFLVDKKGLIATCCHVLSCAGENLLEKEFTFQFLATKSILRVVVVKKDQINDVALLQALDPMPPGAEVAVLVYSSAVQPQMTFQVTGYGKIRDVGQAYEYVSAIGRIVGPMRRNEVDLLQLESRQILLGMSGAPLFVEELGGVVGIISGRYSTDPKAQTWLRDTAWAARIEALAGLGKTIDIYTPRDIRGSSPYSQSAVSKTQLVKVNTISSTDTKAVFLSYKSEDVELVKRIYSDLQLRGVTSIWMDRENLEGGDKWREVITEAIANCTHMVVCISPLALKSIEVQFEYELADRQGKTIIPLILHTSKYDDLPPVLHSRQTFNIPHDGYEKIMVQLAQSLPRQPYLLSTMQKVPVGAFIMGNPGEKVTIDKPFWIGKTVVTVTEYVCFVNAGGYENDGCWKNGTLERWRKGSREETWPHRRLEAYALDHPRQPMRGLTWYEALAYCSWLTFMTDHPFTLPSEMEWEKAARGEHGLKFATGNTLDPKKADIREGDTPRLEPKDCGIEQSESPYGCQDMVGQVWNWTLSTPVPGCNATEPSYDDLDKPRIIRSGSWRQAPSKARAFHRESQSPIPEDYRFEIGFRLVTHENPSHLFPAPSGWTEQS